ncbi:hypothetical protein [Bacillus pretiosus]|uniref:hypothetical protein n=1 Tax=Bacillus pretiosus TaxID=2983392 RepID=UPI003D65C819
MRYSTLSLDFENKVVIDKTKWKEIWDDFMEPDSYEEIIKDFNEEDIEFLLKRDLKSLLIENVDRFTNPRNIENSVKISISKELTEKF